MSDKPKLALGLQKDQIKNETVEKQNTATRIGQMLEDMLDSMLTLQDNLTGSLSSTSTTHALNAAAGKQLKDLVDNMQSEVVAISLILQSNDINLDEFQEIVDAIKSLQTSATLLAGKPVDTTGRATGKILEYDETLNEGTGGYKHVDKPTSGTGGGPAVAETYDDIADRDADVANLEAGQIVKVLDASGDDTVESGYAYYEYEGSSTFRKLSEEESMDVEASGGGTPATNTNVTIPNGTTALNFSSGTIQNVSISEAKVFNSILNPVLGETREFIFDGSNAVSFHADLLGVKQNSFKLGETNRVIVFAEKVDSVTPANNSYIITFVNSNDGVGDGSITDAKLATNVKIGSLALFLSTAKTSVQAAFNELWNKVAGNVTVAKNKQILFNNNGNVDGTADMTWDNSTKTAEFKGDGTSSIYEFDEGSASGNSGWKIPNNKSSSGRVHTATDEYVDYDTINKRIRQKQTIRRELASSVEMITGGSGQSTSATEITLETIAIPTDSIVTIRSRVDAKIAALTTSSHKEIIQSFKNVGGTVSQVAAATATYTAAAGSYNGTSTGVPSFAISGTNVNLNFAGAASITADVTSITTTKYN